MRSFITALQFLTRIHLVRQEDLTAEDFGRSTRFFPLVGAVLGCLYLLAALACLALLGLPSYTAKAILVILPILLTEGSLAPVSCLTPNTTPCSRIANCRTYEMWKGLNDLISNYFGNITLADLARPDQAGNDYVI